MSYDIKEKTYSDFEVVNMIRNVLDKVESIKVSDTFNKKKGREIKIKYYGVKFSHFVPLSPDYDDAYIRHALSEIGKQMGWAIIAGAIKQCA